MKRKKSPNGQRQIRLCACGCGKQVREFHNSNGRFIGYGKLALGCERTYSKQSRVRMSKKYKGMNAPWAKPLLSRHKNSRGPKSYWKIKVGATPRKSQPKGTADSNWQFEHRYLMEKKLGRKLGKNERVHHINGNTLDNRIKNLVVMTDSAHRSLTAKKTMKTGRSCCSYPKCKVCGWRHPPHKG